MKCKAQFDRNANKSVFFVSKPKQRKNKFFIVENCSTLKKKKKTNENEDIGGMSEQNKHLCKESERWIGAVNEECMYVARKFRQFTCTCKIM